MHPVAARRILRMALGTALSLACSQLSGWQLSFIAPIFTLLILSLPLPAPRLKAGVVFVAALLAPMLLGLSLIPLLTHARWAGILLLALALYYSFWFTARGGSAVLGTFMTVGLTLVVTIGSVNGTLLIALIHALAVNAAIGIAFVWVAHALLPDLPRDAPAAGRPKAPQTVDPQKARRDALRALLVVLPVALLFLFVSGSPAYTPVMIKVASMGQQATNEDTRKAGKSLLMSTFIGGVGAVIAWQMLSIAPTLSLYTVIVALAGLVIGARVFQGDGLAPNGPTWSYAYLTMLVILAPAVLDTSGVAAGAKFNDRLVMFVLTTVYAVVAVNIVDAFRPKRIARYLASSTAG